MGGYRQDLCVKLFTDSEKLKSACNRGVVQSRLQMLHVHVFFFTMVYLLQLQFSDHSISKHDCKQPARSILPLCIKISIYRCA